MLIEITETKDRYSADVCFNKLDEIYQMHLVYLLRTVLRKKKNGE